MDRLIGRRDPDARAWPRLTWREALGGWRYVLAFDDDTGDPVVIRFRVSWRSWIHRGS